MKKVNILIALLAIAIFTVSCESYDDYNTDRKNVVGFITKERAINNIPEGGTKSATVDLFMTDLSNVDRTFNIIDVPALSEPATARENYTFDATVTFLANTREASITVTGIDNSIEGEEYFALAVEGEGDVVSGGIVSVRVRN